MHLDAAAIAVIQNLDRQIERREITEERGHPENLAGRVAEWLSLFLGQQAREFGCVLLDNVGDGKHHLLAFGDRGLVGAWAGRKHILGGRVDDVHRRVTLDHLSINQKLVLSHHRPPTLF